MLRAIVWLALLQLAFVSQVSAERDRKLGISLGPDTWVEFGSGRCETAGDATRCGGELEGILVGAHGTFDLNALRWLRMGLNGAFAFELNETQVVGNGGYSETQRHWLVPLGLHTHAHFEPNSRVSFWAGPEIAYMLGVDARSRSAPGMKSTARATRSGLLAGMALGIDARIGDGSWFGFLVGESVSYAQQRALPRPTVGSMLSALTRFGLVFRHFF